MLGCHHRSLSLGLNLCFETIGTLIKTSHFVIICVVLVLTGLYLFDNMFVVELNRSLALRWLEMHISLTE